MPSIERWAQLTPRQQELYEILSLRRFVYAAEGAVLTDAGSLR